MAGGSDPLEEVGGREDVRGRSLGEFVSDHKARRKIQRNPCEKEIINIVRSKLVRKVGIVYKFSFLYLLELQRSLCRARS